MASLDSSMPPRTDCSAGMSCGGWRSKPAGGAAPTSSVTAISAPPPSQHGVQYRTLVRLVATPTACAPRDHHRLERAEHAANLRCGRSCVEACGRCRPVLCGACGQAVNCARCHGRARRVTGPPAVHTVCMTESWTECPPSWDRTGCRYGGTHGHLSSWVAAGLTCGRAKGLVGQRWACTCAVRCRVCSC